MTEQQKYQVRLRDLRDYVFLNGQIPWKFAAAMYVALAAISVGVAPQLFPGTKAYYLLIGTPLILVMYKGRQSLDLAHVEGHVNLYIAPPPTSLLVLACAAD